MSNLKKYRKLYFVCILFFVAIFFAPVLDLFLNYLNSNFGIWTAIILGYFYSFSFTGGVSSVMISNVSSNFLLFSLLSAFGSMLADFTLLKILKVNFEEEVKNLFDYLRINKYFSNRLKTFLAIVIIGSPLPDEIGVMLLSQTNKFSKVQFLTICFFANFFFVFLISKFL
jgi:pheromone shutdown protein TraB